jgi:HAD superfamily hydrolase (TIGR01484 family)
MLLLCTDLDRTLLPNGIQPESSRARGLFAELAASAEVVLAYVTGRHLGLVQRAIGNYRLPMPDFVIADVGTRIYRRASGAWQQDAGWEAEIDPDWRGRGHRDLHGMFADLAPLRLQGADRQHRHKLSYFVPLHTDVEALLHTMQQRLAGEQVRAELIWSIDEPAGIGLLDVLPASATKLHAVEYLRGQLGLDYADCLFAGDSGNDLPALASAVPAVLVANASDSVRDAALHAAREQGHEDRLYLARGGLLGMNGNYSAGILEGVAHFHPDYLQGLTKELENDAG